MKTFTQNIYIYFSSLSINPFIPLLDVLQVFRFVSKYRFSSDCSRTQIFCIIYVSQISARISMLSPIILDTLEREHLAATTTTTRIQVKIELKEIFGRSSAASALVATSNNWICVFYVLRIANNVLLCHLFRIQRGQSTQHSSLNV